MRCAGLDPALSAGWAFGDSAERPNCGVWKLPGFSDVLRPRSLAGIYSSTMAMVRANGIEAIAIEAPQMNISRKNARGITTPTSSHGTRSLTMLSGAAQAGAHNGGAKYIWLVDPSVWRKAVLGNGYPSAPKAAAISYCWQVFKMRVTEEDAAEAVCLMAYAHGQSKLI